MFHVGHWTLSVVANQPRWGDSLNERPRGTGCRRKGDRPNHVISWSAENASSLHRLADDCPELRPDAWPDASFATGLGGASRSGQPHSAHNFNYLPILRAEIHRTGNRASARGCQWLQRGRAHYHVRLRLCCRQGPDRSHDDSAHCQCTRDVLNSQGDMRPV